MKLVFVKIDEVEQVEGTEQRVLLHIPTGGIQFGMRDKVIILAEPVTIEMKQDGTFVNVVRNVTFDVYTDLSLNPTEQQLPYSLFSVVAHEDFYMHVYAYFRHTLPARMTERELYEAEYATEEVAV